MLTGVDWGYGRFSLDPRVLLRDASSDRDLVVLIASFVIYRGVGQRSGTMLPLSLLTYEW
jgi:hypothetical protein